MAASQVTAELNSHQIWAAQVAGHADLPDQRLNVRLAEILGTLASKPEDSIPQATGAKAPAKATYRFLSNRRIVIADLLKPLVDTTVAACRGHATIYAIHDSTSFNFSTLTQTKGLGPLNDSLKARGIHLHSTLALTSTGVVLGLLHQHYWTRPVHKRTKAKRKQRPFHVKESYKWYRGLEATEASLGTLPASDRPRVIHVMDREGDVYEVLQRIAQSGDGGIIRCAHDRNVAGAIAKAHAAVHASPPLGTHTVAVPPRPQQPARMAVLEVRAVPLTLTPDTRRHAQRQPVPLSLVEAQEINAPPGVEALHWLLWTTEPAANFAAAVQVIQGYRCRPRVEDFHLTLKSGCQVERLELETAQRLIKALVLYSGIAARIVALRDLARQQPDAPCTQLVHDDEWRVLYTHIHHHAPAATMAVPTIRQVVLWIGRLGGHLGRKCDRLPGVRTLWRGWRDLTILVDGYRAARHLR